MESVSQLSCPQPPNRSSTTRRDFLKSSLVSSVAVAAVRIPAVAEESAARAEARSEDPSIISVTGAPLSAPLQKPWKSAIATGHAALLLRADLQQQLATLQRDICIVTADSTESSTTTWRSSRAGRMEAWRSAGRR